METRELIRKYALQNALKYSGKADSSAVIGKVFAENPSLKPKAKDIISEAKEVIEEIASMSLEQQKGELEQLAPELLEKKEKEEKDIFEFLNIKPGEKIITAFPPEPSKYPHIGHAKAIIVNYELAKRYNGKFYLRFDDTNPKLVREEFYQIHIDNYKWLGIIPDKIEYASDYMEKFYEYAEKLIELGNAYICNCSQEESKDFRFKGTECKCRNSTIEQTKKQWKEMFNSKGGATLRLKIDMQHKNTTMRDPSIMRIIHAKHPRLKKEHSVWPTYDFETTMMDSLQGITHRIRSKEFEMRNELQRFIQNALGFNETNIFEFARFNMEGVESSGRIIREKIQNKELIGWDDPSLTTLVALKRRGFEPEAIYSFVLSTGITKTESTLTWDTLYSFNKRILDAKTNRYFFIENPVKIKIEGSPDQKIEIKLHPDFPDRGNRRFNAGNEFFITKKDYENFKENRLNRLMDCLNFAKKGNKFIFDSLDYETYSKTGDKILHWLPANGDNVHTEILMPDSKIIKGIAEETIKNLKIGEVIQFARFGFCRLDNIEDGIYRFWFTHR